MPDKDYGETGSVFGLYGNYVTTVFDEAAHRMILRERHGRVMGYPVKTMAERQNRWRETTTKDEMILLFKAQYEDNPLDYITRPELFEQDVEFSGEFSGGLSDESALLIEEMRRDIEKKHKAYTGGEDKTYFNALFSKKAADEIRIRKTYGGGKKWQSRY
ncbi:MAG: hypothetical protein LBH35_00970 [Treponema sp.]|jgi:hypothetical protein|nr:hypothetical protein [Treponema sp.]